MTDEYSWGNSLEKLKRKKLYENVKSIVLLLVLIVVQVVIFSIMSPYFFKVGNFINIARQVAEIGIIAIPTAILIISGSIDMSLGSTLGFCAMSFGLLMKAGNPIWLAAIATIGIGALIGVFNGFFVAVLNIPGIVSTIGSMVFIRGLCYIINKGNPVNGFSKEFIQFGNTSIMKIPLSFFVMSILYIVAAVLLQKSKFGVKVYSIGNNERAVRFCGIRTNIFMWKLFILNGMLIAVASIFLLARLGSAEATLGQNYDLDVLASVLIGGISIFGGKGHIMGAFLGLLAIGILRNGLNIIGVSVLYQSMILGVLLILTAAKWRKIKD